MSRAQDEAAYLTSLTFERMRLVRVVPFHGPEVDRLGAARLREPPQIRPHNRGDLWISARRRSIGHHDDRLPSRPDRAREEAVGEEFSPGTVSQGGPSRR